MPSILTPPANHAMAHDNALRAAADRKKKSKHPATGQRSRLDEDGPASTVGAAERHSQAVGSLLQAVEREMNAALALRKAHAELSMLLEAIWPGCEDQPEPEDQNEGGNFAGAGAFLVPPVLPATLDELEAHYRSARAVWEESQRHKGAAIERFLHARADRMS